MKILILGGNGMIGHQLYASLRARHQARVLMRRPFDLFASFNLFRSDDVYDGIDVRMSRHIVDVLGRFRPDVTVNAVGIIKQRHASDDVAPYVETNALFPHYLARIVTGFGGRLVHLSTDCVFSGARGGYAEDDVPDATDVYGRTKQLGEPKGPGIVTLRTSLVGLELGSSAGLVEWALAQTGARPGASIRGYPRALFNGFTTLEFARIVEFLIVECTELTGLWHLASSSISKHDFLLGLLNRVAPDARLHADLSFACNRTLRAEPFTQETGYRPPSWDVMLDELAESVQRRTYAGRPV